MKALLLVVLVSFPAFALETMLPPVRTTTAQAIPGGVGADFTQLLVRAKDSDFLHGFSRGRFFIQYDYVHRAVGWTILPEFQAQQKCEFRRASGGRVGDYKPKSVVNGIWLGKYQAGYEFWIDNHANQDFNENPVVMSYPMTNLPRTIQIPAPLQQELTRACQLHGNEAKIDIYFATQTLCRWKPENWHKPGNFPFEYALPHTMIKKQIRVWCVDRP